ncbi:MAG: hypothetical protein QF593_10280, partial [Nitrospinota bacterium]|nr:hypothetical protein [Nitrospinota bacterium]
MSGKKICSRYLGAPVHGELIIHARSKNQTDSPGTFPFGRIVRVLPVSEVYGFLDLSACGEGEDAWRGGRRFRIFDGFWGCAPGVILRDDVVPVTRRSDCGTKIGMGLITGPLPGGPRFGTMAFSIKFSDIKEGWSVAYRIETTEVQGSP